MLIMQAKHINYTIGDRNLLNVAELSVFHGEKIGLVGRNGAGKTTLLNILSGSEEAEGVHLGTFGKLAYVEQLSNGSEMEEWEKLSGGERTKAKIQEAIGEKPDLLLLDEPANNLDWKAIEELEEMVKKFDGAVIIVSHDRSLLDSLCTKIWEVENGSLRTYKGNYSSYRAQKELERKEQESRYAKYVREKKNLTEIQKNKEQQAKGMDKPPSRMGRSEWTLYKNKAAGKRKKIERVSKTLQARIERLEENKPEQPVDLDEMKLEMELATPVNRKNIIEGKDLVKMIGSRILYTIPSFKLRTGSKTALIGDNGSGKTTFFDQICKQEGLDIADAVKIGYFQQEIEKLPRELTILEAVKKTSIHPEHIVRTILARLRFFREDVHKKIEVLSGGERSKVAIARLAAGDFNLLLLDEPTNHLDADAIEALEELLIQYPGTVFYISHDRYFIEKTATNLYFLQQGELTGFAGGLKEWKQTQQRRPAVSYDEQEYLRLDNKKAELISKLSMPEPGVDIIALEEQYTEVVKKLNKLKDAK
ncbi:ribosomal protection-like ABC-F family protein [Bacillus marinisedimentorum]|uniref:ribosomal protection-like ABC-F family protein n=1 Tax=Bacillus marinisedimentorum TaxID=1821260 RepID=UPI00087270A6|nr:ABC-F family ATP-binding cassette domain-containing protein [Bacillus marinisedimentorum]